MAITTKAKVRLLSNLTTNDISDNDVDSIIVEVTKELNSMINVKVVRERVLYIDNTRQNDVNGSNTTFYVKNWKGKYLADRDNDGDVDTSDVLVHIVSSDGTETTATVSSIDQDDGKFVLSSAPTSDKEVYVTYDWTYRDVSTPDPMVELAATLLTCAYCWLKINTGMAPQQSWGNVKLYRHMDAFNTYYARFLKVVSQINDRGIIDSREAKDIF